MEKANLTDLDRQVLDGIFLLCHGYVGISKNRIEDRVHAYYTLSPTKGYDFEYVLVRTNNLKACVTDREFSDHPFNFDRLSFTQQSKFFVLLSMREYQRHSYADVIGIAPACQNMDDLAEFWNIIQEYGKHPDVCKPAIERSFELAKFLHANYVTEAEFKEGKQKQLPLHHFVLWGVPPEGYHHTNDLLNLYWS